MRHTLPPISPARRAAIETLTTQLQQFEQMPPLAVDETGLAPRDARLAVAIHRTCLQRWLTLRYLLKRCAHRWPRSMQPVLEATLISGAAQLLFMDKLPVHAVVHESVELVKRQVRPQAASFANAVLRRVADLVSDRHDHVGYLPSVTSLPWRGGHLTLNRPLLPPLKEVDNHFSIATSHPVYLVARWREQFGKATALEMLRHNLAHAPTIIHAADASTPPPDADFAVPHEQPGFLVWRGDYEALGDYLNASPARWVQDPASAAAVRTTADLQPRQIVDYCAGKGTKTRQLAQLHPEAHILASDPDGDRLADLERAFADHPRVEVLDHPTLRNRSAEADLLVLDVPCSNTGVLARRLEARYRFNPESLASVTALQRQIITEAAPLLRPGGRLLYTTCSLEPEENGDQARFAADHLETDIDREEQILPAGLDTTWHDGSYHALLTPRGSRT